MADSRRPAAHLRAAGHGARPFGAAFLAAALAMAGFDAEQSSEIDSDVIGQ
jgi:hypothetical protein